MAATPSVRVLKTFSYKGSTKTWSNRYHFNGGTPANGTAWNTLSDAIVLAEKAIYEANVTIVQVIGYAAGSDVPVNSKTYSTTGTLGGVPSCYFPGDAAMVGRYATTARSSKNHPVYLFNYWHGGTGNSTSADTQIWTTQKTAVGTYAASWMSGFSDGTNTLVRAGPNGATATGFALEPYPGHRDFPH